ncbi:hypothetical protein CcaverHIS002_0303190 [Cutaneotrichosporon cavernicola]|uniref:Mid2 domain-containing protein n=1 Tax=Cutaneotrichosporon cavernicola TaxID=279322 RepID=A0AA48I2X8_9TREE|nr:uncharacterized protein CcaverHIS019_0303190 [Cutaneotrichosporon cavernicola]BEI82451.1 hypothetical protein CcaverHIS002_0303190 [Cutaneotrichosporon cavernicola]BEI90249.1 hypothetical protein CcaverHIS019_0303190 [Cutaneotrichosporon cavernicola]BEI98026.1 hypothetical protein CcaverHIS631_0303250 [Cutaneotrichosporon cavernicola]BEJ05803.1 hypothetical protein CcaverHIS641_0303250 [Cutaneotrichosporon cavernicola]
MSSAPPPATPVEPPVTPTSSPPTPPISNTGGGGGGGGGDGSTSEQPPNPPSTTQQPPEPPTTSLQPIETPTTSENQPPSTTDRPPPETTTQNEQSTTRQNEQPSTFEEQQSTTSTSRGQTSTTVVHADGGTSFKYVTVTDSRGLAHTSAVAMTPHKNNTPAIVGGVVGGVGGALAIAGIIAFLLYRRKKNRDVAFDEKMFDPHHSTRHSQIDPLDLAEPTSPSVGMPGEPTTIEPFPYEPQGQYDYDPYRAAGPMHGMQVGDTMQMHGMSMPEASDYMYGNNNYGYAAAGAGAGMTAAEMKHREATGSLSPQQTGLSSSAGGSRNSHYEDAYSQHHHQAYQGYQPYPTSPQRSAPSDGAPGLYQHTDMLSEPSDDMQEIPPNYDSIRR